MLDPDFQFDAKELQKAVLALAARYQLSEVAPLSTDLPEVGVGSGAALDELASRIIGGAAALGGPAAFAHMDPPTPWITWAMSLWNASLNQNLLHPATAPAAGPIEQLVIAWLAPFFGMSGGHMTPGSTIANLTALWAARECAQVQEVVASESAHLSIAKSAHILGLRYRALPTDSVGALIPESLPKDLSRAALVLTAGTTGTGAIDPLDLSERAAWTHIDAAWAGPLRLTTHAVRLSGIEYADSVAISAHKWLFQPKESALVLFRDVTKAHAAMTFGGSYLVTPNVGLLGSHGAAAVPLLATLLAFGRRGIAERIERCVMYADRIASCVAHDARFTLLAEPKAGIVIWRPKEVAQVEQVFQCLLCGAASMTIVAGERWIRMVAANPNADIDLLLHCIRGAL